MLEILFYFLFNKYENLQRYRNNMCLSFILFSFDCDCCEHIVCFQFHLDLQLFTVFILTILSLLDFGNPLKQTNKDSLRRKKFPFFQTNKKFRYTIFNPQIVCS